MDCSYKNTFFYKKLLHFHEFIGQIFFCTQFFFYFAPVVNPYMD